MSGTSGCQRTTGLSTANADSQISNGTVAFAFATATSGLIVRAKNATDTIQYLNNTYALSLSTECGSINISLSEGAVSVWVINILTENGRSTWCD